MVEMIELAQILHRADHRSLLILDEVGRGTSTYDGMSVAWSTLEFLAQHLPARTLFATHYHELTELPSRFEAIENAHLAVENTAEGGLRFLYELRSGPTNDSFGVQVAQLAGLPPPVIQRAWSVLRSLESENRKTPVISQRSIEVPQSQLSLFPESDPRAVAALKIVDSIAELNPNEMTPIQALTTLMQIQKETLSCSQKRS
jgi:DNA mismatch repair protein MutS